jgi:hypothetical protein
MKVEVCFQSLFQRMPVETKEYQKQALVKISSTLDFQIEYLLENNSKALSLL